MSQTPNPTPPTVEQAEERLLRAVRRVAAIHGLRQGLAHTIAYTETRADPTDPGHWEALDALAVWRALAGLIDAVITERNSDS